MTNKLFTLSGSGIIYIINVSFKLVYLLLSNIKTKLHFSTGKSYPQLSPSSEFLVSRENILHFLACISGTKRAFIRICHCSSTSFVILYNVYTLIIAYFLRVYNRFKEKCLQWDSIG